MDNCPIYSVCYRQFCCACRRLGKMLQVRSRILRDMECNPESRRIWTCNSKQPAYRITIDCYPKIRYYYSLIQIYYSDGADTDAVTLTRVKHHNDDDALEDPFYIHDYQQFSQENDSRFCCSTLYCCKDRR